MATFTLLLVVVAGFQLLTTIAGFSVTLIAANAAKESARAATDAVGLARLQNRAWVGIKAVRPHRQVEHLRGAHIGFTADVTNTGKTPALNLGGWWIIYRTPNDQPIDFQTASTNRVLFDSKAPLLPNAEVHLGNAKARLTTPENDAAVQSGTKHLYFFGELTYRDVFGGEHVTRFAYRLDPTTGSLNAPSEHNEAT
jgi:hypothetical protein